MEAKQESRTLLMRSLLHGLPLAALVLVLTLIPGNMADERVPPPRWSANLRPGQRLNKGVYNQEARLLSICIFPLSASSKHDFVTTLCWYEDSFDTHGQL
jgi:hypothetical protein